MRSFVEYREVTVTDPLRQGDVIEAVDPEASKWQRHLLVITADCDFANAKNQGRVTCVPLLSQDEFLLEFQIPRVRERVVKKSIAALAILIAKSGGPKISDTRLRDWPMELEPERIVQDLGLTQADAEVGVKLLESIRSATLPAPRLDEAVSNLVNAQIVVPGGKEDASARRDVKDALTAYFRNPPGDALFLSAVAPDHESGYFVYLRHLEQIREPEIALGPTRSVVSYRRLARLQDRFTHAISQQFALVFMAIGLPTEYEEARDVHSYLLGERFS